MKQRYGIPLDTRDMRLDFPLQAPPLPWAPVWWSAILHLTDPCGGLTKPHLLEPNGITRLVRDIRLIEMQWVTELNVW